MMVSVLLAGILFGTPGPVMHKTYADSTVSADIAYRIAPDKLYGTGEAALPPAIADGTLTYRTHGQLYTFDLANILPIVEHHIELPDSPRDGCGASEALTRHGHYLAVEYYYAEKGCFADAAFIEISTGTVVRISSLDWIYNHRLELTAPHFIGTPGIVHRVETIELRRCGFSLTAKAGFKCSPWTFRAIHWTGSHSERQILAYEVLSRRLNGTADPGAAFLPQPGETMSVGTFEKPRHLIYEEDIIVRFDASDNRNYAALQPPTSQQTQRAIIRQEWLTVADQRANNGDLPGAVQALEKMLDYEDDDHMMQSEGDQAAACRTYIPIAAKKHLSKAEIATLFSNGCKPSN